jgi:hypothetical protein
MNVRSNITRRSKYTRAHMHAGVYQWETFFCLGQVKLRAARGGEYASPYIRHR